MELHIPPVTTRRQFLRYAAVTGPAASLVSHAGAQVPPARAPVTISVHPDAEIVSVPVNYNGLSYESAQLAYPEFFASTNTHLIPFFRRLAAQGVLRIGGNTSEFTVWSPQGAPPATSVAVGPDAGGAKHRTPITPQAIRNLAGFLDAAGWQLIYGLNLGHGTPEKAAEEAAAVASSVGDRLIAFQIGNEPDLYYRNGLRPPNWTFHDYFSQWQEFARAVRKRVPNAPFGAPDVANNVDWIVDFAQKGANEIALLTGHYYAEGPPTDPSMNIARLLLRDPRLLADVPRIMRASRAAHRPFRMTEGNSCYHGGKPGVSNSFASALWAADYMLFLAQNGYVGVNFHGGDNGVYTPIAGAIETGFSARPVYYGLLMGQQFAGSRMVETHVEANGINVTAYAAKAGSALLVAIFNKAELEPVHALIHTGAAGRRATAWRLTAPHLESISGVRLAGAEVESDASWTPREEEPVPEHNGQYTFDLPPASAALMFLR